MRSWRNNPEGEEQVRAHYENEREIFALKMQAMEDAKHYIAYNHNAQRADCAWTEVFDSREEAEKYVENRGSLHDFEIMECDKDGEPL